MKKVAMRLCSMVLCSVAWTVFARASDVTTTIRIVKSADAKQVSPSNVVVWLSPLDTSSPLVPRQNVRLVQKNKEFVPHLLVIPIGTSVDFPNMDPFFHNVFSFFNGKRFDLGLYEAGSHRVVTFDREGISYIFCNIHPEMGAVVVSLNSPYYAVSDDSGTVVLHGVPAGRYRLKTWAERLSPIDLAKADQIVEVPNGPLNMGALQFRISDAVGTHHKTKFGKDYPQSSDSGYSGVP